MILIHKFEPAFAVEEKHFDIIRLHDELVKILDFIDLPDAIRDIEQKNSAILRNYYANALDHNLLDIKTVKYIVNNNIKPRGTPELAVEQYAKAEAWLNTQLAEPLSMQMMAALRKLLITDIYTHHDSFNLFNAANLKAPERLSPASELELEALFEFMNNDVEYHPVHQAWILHFRLLGIPLFPEVKSRLASLLQFFWLKKKGYELNGLLSLEHEIYLEKNRYLNFIGADASQTHAETNDMNEQVSFGMILHETHLARLKQLLRTYYRKQVDFDKLNPRQKNIMNYVFENGYKLKEMDETILNKRQKLIMYIVQNKGFISTKELVNEFDCNRKTIQRDFTVLTDLNLVRVIGQGAGLKYAVNLQREKHSVMEKYQADFLKESDQPLAEEEVA